MALDIKPFISADGKYVLMDLKTQMADIEMATETMQYSQMRFNNGGGNIINGGGNVDNGSDLSSPSSSSIELPTMHLRSAATTVLIPDHGTLLVGGFRTATETATSTKIPFLGHIPFLGRLFGERGRYSNRRQVFLMATVHIINYQELEATL
jgi:type II secretory pathway component GspD/PulD (secretin)